MLLVSPLSVLHQCLYIHLVRIKPIILLQKQPMSPTFLLLCKLGIAIGHHWLASPSSGNKTNGNNIYLHVLMHKNVLACMPSLHVFRVSNKNVLGTSWLNSQSSKLSQSQSLLQRTKKQTLKPKKWLSYQLKKNTQTLDNKNTKEIFLITSLFFTNGLTMNYNIFIQKNPYHDNWI